MLVHFLPQLLFILLNVVNQVNETRMASKKLISLDFEVYGRVQGVFFRKYTQEEAIKLKLTGWCMNTERGTVQGVIQGEIDKIEMMKKWLQTMGSPSARIQKAEFTNQMEITNYTFHGFEIKR